MATKRYAFVSSWSINHKDNSVPVSVITVLYQPFNNSNCTEKYTSKKITRFLPYAHKFYSSVGNKKKDNFFDSSHHVVLQH
jgi:hypothetical protein